jgi:hypothetical protein
MCDEDILTASPRECEEGPLTPGVGAYYHLDLRALDHLSTCVGHNSATFFSEDCAPENILGVKKNERENWFWNYVRFSDLLQILVLQAADKHCTEWALADLSGQQWSPVVYGCSVDAIVDNNFRLIIGPVTVKTVVTVGSKIGQV